jgi:hypothetical protein
MTAWADKSETIDALSAAFVKALGEMQDIVKTQTANAGQYAYSYATLADAFGMARPILAANDLAISQTAEATHDEVIIWTTVLHSSGQYITHAPIRLPAGKTAQNTGSALSYGKRYALMAILGLATEDDDGANASPRGERPRPQARAPKPTKQPAVARTDEETEIRNMLASIPSQAAARIRGEFKAVFGGGLADLSPDRHGEALDWMVGAVSEWEHDNAEAPVE